MSDKDLQHTKKCNADILNSCSCDYYKRFDAARIKETFTPGPWQIENESIDKEGRQGYRIGNPKIGIVFDMVYTGHFAADNPEAHAKLVAAAPDLLAALEKAQESLLGMQEALHSFGAGYGLGATWQAIEEAINKARGIA